jgi:hypothetical protein
MAAMRARPLTHRTIGYERVGKAIPCGSAAISRTASLAGAISQWPHGPLLLATHAKLPFHGRKRLLEGQFHQLSEILMQE